MKKSRKQKKPMALLGLFISPYFIPYENKDMKFRGLSANALINMNLCMVCTDVIIFHYYLSVFFLIKANLINNSICQMSNLESSCWLMVKVGENRKCPGIFPGK